MIKSNLILRTITGVCFVSIIILSFFANPIFFGALFTLITAFTIAEFCNIINKSGAAKVNVPICSLGGAFLFVAFMSFANRIMDGKIFIPYLLIFMFILIRELYLKAQNPIANWAYSMFSQIYIAIPFSLLNVLAFSGEPFNEELPSFNSIIPLSVFIFIWLNDTGAYCVGSLIGKHRLFERISPKKSWEGSIGGAVFAIISSLIIAHYTDMLSYGKWVGMAVVVVIFATWGDLIESLFKRTLNIKDSGNILPGHGGLLDRFDSALLALPAATLYLYIINTY